MITKDEMIPTLLEVLPSFQSEWDSFTSEWKDVPELPETGLPIYIVLSDLARFLIKLLETEDFETLKSVFTVIEAWQVDGDPYVKETATVGLLEDIQNRKLHRTTTPNQFAPFLGPVSRIGWKDLYAFWKDESK